MTTFEHVTNLISAQLHIDKTSISESSRLLEDLHADSANVMMLVMDLEQECGIMMEDDALMKLRTVGDIVKYIDSHK